MWLNIGWFDNFYWERDVLGLGLLQLPTQDAEKRLPVRVVVGGGHTETFNRTGRPWFRLKIEKITHWFHFSTSARTIDAGVLDGPNISESDQFFLSFEACFVMNLSVESLP